MPQERPFEGGKDPTLLSEDFDLDGYLDLVVLNFHCDEISYLRGGPGGLEDPVHISVGDGPWGTLQLRAAGHLDGDEYPDLLRLKEKAVEDVETEDSKLGETEQKVLDLVGLEPVHVDDIIGRADLSPTEASHILLLLQLEGLIEEVEGGRYIRKP